MPFLLAAVAYYVVLNVLAFVLFARDKAQARAGGWRIPERTLLTVVGLGGFAGSFLAMRWLRHKTRHTRFWVAVALAAALHLAMLAWVAPAVEGSAWFARLIG
jgi:uncharacterized membrane protein YsdA (DUF1294 family)